MSVRTLFNGSGDGNSAAAVVSVGSMVWNTCYMDSALDYLRANEGHVRTEDVNASHPYATATSVSTVATTSPSDAVARGELRSLQSVGP